MFGFGVGKIELNLAKTAFAGGETIEGTLLLTVKKPVKAKGLFVKLYATQLFQEQFNSMGKPEMREVKKTIYNFQESLDTEKEYPVCDAKPYPFKLVMPPMDNSTPRITNPLGNLSIAFNGFQIGGGAGPCGLPMWGVEGFLDIPMAFDVKANVSVVHQ
jgi:hypothetical protein